MNLGLRFLPRPIWGNNRGGWRGGLVGPNGYLNDVEFFLKSDCGLGILRFLCSLFRYGNRLSTLQIL